MLLILGRLGESGEKVFAYSEADFKIFQSSESSWAKDLSLKETFRQGKVKAVGIAFCHHVFHQQCK